MTVDFREHFWGERNAGFELLYRNCKQSQATSKELQDYIRERAQIEENYSKLLAKLAGSRLLGSGSSVAPLWAALRTSTEKAASVHAQLSHQLGDSLKEMHKYSDEQHRKQKLVKDEEQATMEAVTTLQQHTLLLAKTKEALEARKAEASELKRKKALEDYRAQTEKHEQARVNFIHKMTESCARFQVLEENHLSAIKSFIDGYIRTMMNCYATGTTMCNDLQSAVDNLSIEHLLDKFVQQRGTGRERPEPHKMLQETPPLSSNSLHNAQSQSAEDVFKPNSISNQTAAHQSSQSSLYEFLGRNLTLRGRHKSTKSESSPEVSVVGHPLNVQTAPLVDEDGFSVPPPPPQPTTEPPIKMVDSSSDDSSGDEAEYHKKIVVKIKPISEANRNMVVPPARLVSPPARLNVISPESNGNRTPPSILSELPKSIIPRPPSRRSVDRTSPSPMTRAESIASIGSSSTGVLSRGPSPLTLGLGDIIPIAVAFQEVVHASFRGAEESQCKVRIFGDMKMSFPNGILGALLSHPNPPPLHFVLHNLPTQNLAPNSLLVAPLDEHSGLFRVEMQELVCQLKRLHEAHPGQSYFNVDLMKYSLDAGAGAASAPLHLVTYWNCDSSKSDLKVDYLYNWAERFSQRPCNAHITVTLPSSASVTNVHSKPPCSWNSANKKAMWKVVNIKAGSILARFQHDEPLQCDPPGEVGAQFSIEDASFSEANFTLAPPSGYRVSLVKRRIISGRYTAVM